MPSKVEPSIPPMTTVPSVWRDIPPEPVANQSGRHPKTKANDVIRIGRNRMRAPISAASDRDLPFSTSVLAYSTMRMAFLADSQINMMSPIWT